MTESTGNGSTGKIDTYYFPANVIANSDAAAYKQAAEDFLLLDNKRFIHKYPELKMPLENLSPIDLQVHTAELADPLDATVKLKISKEIAAAKYPIIDHQKSRLMAITYAGATTPSLRTEAIKAYPQLAEAFKVGDVMKGIANIPPDAVEDQIEKGIVPQYNALISKIAARRAAMHATEPGLEP